MARAVIDEYLDTVAPVTRATVERLRGYYPVSGSVRGRAPDVARYEQTQGSWPFDHDRTLSQVLVEEMVIERHRIDMEKRAKRVKS